MQRLARLGIGSLLAFVLVLPVQASAAAPTVHQVAAELKRDPVYVAPSKRGQLPPRAARRLRQEIARLDRGRIQVALVPAASADRVGGIGGFGNAVDQAWGAERRGALIATTGQDFQVVTSYRDVDPTLGALQHAVNTFERAGLDRQLLAGVRGIADVDPGPSQDINGPPAGGGAVAPSNPAGGSSGGGSNVGAIVAIVLGAIVLLPLLGLGLWALARWRRQRQAASQMEELDLGSARDELLALGQDIEDLDIDTQMPNASPAGLQEYQRALMLYDRGNRALAHEDPSQVQISEAKRAVEEGRARIQAARNLLGTRPAVPPDSGGETVHPSP